MSTNIVQLDSHRNNPTLEGEAVCTACQHKWHAVKPTGGSVWLECPECHTERGLFNFAIAPSGDGNAVWVCTDCGGEAFMIVRNPNAGIMTASALCLGCGLYSEPWPHC